MATLRDIRRRIASVQNTRKITKAMEMVAAAKLRRNQQRIEALRAYAAAMVEMMRDLATYAEHDLDHPLLQAHDEERTVSLIAMTGDRGLAGSFNASVIRRVLEEDSRLRAEGMKTRLTGVGKKGIGTLKFRGHELVASWQDLSDHPEYHHARAITKRMIEVFVGGETDRVRVFYNHFVSPIEQRLVDVTILPIPHQEVTGGAGRRPVSYLYEPNPADIFERLLPAYIEITVYRALLESSASEQGARMSAMRNASEAAEEMIDDLTLALNRARQAAITQEILEVVAGAEALG
ncbi:MAG TPA: ATP synthase F1 subunit gamma [Thermoleophilia bacterium]|nr:ATP synthase F1 subunit gamma [Acidobacteriota bacterium]NLT91843.1 ATP synthase F1 subunit gamma [Actinomycetota bacterium]OPZ46953.1 MAG: ATP synthase gamma chain [Actinobacteria bacterium ADurb.BinA094]HOU28220.1 ATP synthase F1 subunit gamma [Thermoleophilia bacterium]HQF52720.1 ATP synthase F1 subunit gamma [Thermoleophilia bacterium]